MRIIAITVLSALLFVGCKQAETQGGIQLITPAEMKEALKMESVQLVDVRTVKEFESGHIKNAQNIVYLSDDWEQQIQLLDKAKPIYVYCAKGGRSAKCADLLEKAGFSKIFDLEGGITQWKKDGLSME